MAFRGGRGGRGGRWSRGGGHHHANQEPFELFPETELPAINPEKFDKPIVTMSLKWEKFWKSSAYYLEERTTNGGQNHSKDIERYSDRAKKRTTSQRDSMYQILQLTSSNFPRVLIAGSKELRSRKRVRWNPLSEMERLEELEKKVNRFWSIRPFLQLFGISRILCFNRLEMRQVERKRRMVTMIATRKMTRTRMKINQKRAKKNLAMMGITIRMSILMTTKTILTWTMAVMMNLISKEPDNNQRRSLWRRGPVRPRSINFSKKRNYIGNIFSSFALLLVIGCYYM